MTLLTMALRSARRAPALLAGTITAVACTVWAESIVRGYGVHDGVVATGALLTSAVLAYVVAAGAGAWTGMRERQWNLGALSRLGARRWYVDRLAVVGALAAVIALGYLVAVTIIAIDLAASPYRNGRLDLTGVAATLLMIVLHAPLGYLVGRLIPRVITPPIVAVVVLVASLSLGSLYGVPLALLVPAAQVDPSVFVRWNGHVFAAQAVWFTGVVAVLALLAGARREPSKPLGIAVAGAAALLVAGAALVVPYHGQRFAPGVTVDPLSCTGARPEICVPPAYLGVQSELRQDFGNLMTKVAGTPAQSDRFELRPRGVGSKPSAGARSIHLDYATAGAAALARQEYIESWLKERYCWEPEGIEAAPWEGIVNQWLTESLEDGRQDGTWPDLVGAPDRRAVRERFAHLTASQQHVWFVAHYKSFVRCTLTAEDFA